MDDSQREFASQVKLELMGRPKRSNRRCQIAAAIVAAAVFFIVGFLIGYFVPKSTTSPHPDQTKPAPQDPYEQHHKNFLDSVSAKDLEDNLRWVVHYALHLHGRLSISKRRSFRSLQSSTERIWPLNKCMKCSRRNFRAGDSFLGIFGIGEITGLRWKGTWMIRNAGSFQHHSFHKFHPLWRFRHKAPRQRWQGAFCLILLQFVADCSAIKHAGF